MNKREENLFYAHNYEQDALIYVQTIYTHLLLHSPFSWKRIEAGVHSQARCLLAS